MSGSGLHFGIFVELMILELGDLSYWIFVLSFIEMISSPFNGLTMIPNRQFFCKGSEMLFIFDNWSQTLKPLYDTLSGVYA